MLLVSSISPSSIPQFLFRNVLPTAAVVLAAAFLAAAALLAIVVPVVVAVVFFVGAFFPLTIVVPLLPALASLLLPFSEPAAALVTVLAPARLVFPARLTAPDRGIVFFSGDRLDDLKGAGGAGRVRELLDRGDKTPAGLVVPGTAAFRPAGNVRVAFELAVAVVVVVGFARLLGLGSSSFSLSAPSDDRVEISSLQTCQYTIHMPSTCMMDTPLSLRSLSLSTANCRLWCVLRPLRRDGHGYRGRRRWTRSDLMFFHQFANIPPAQSLGDAIDAHFQTRSETLGLEIVL